MQYGFDKFGSTKYIEYINKMPIASPPIYFGAVRLPSLLVENLEDKVESKIGTRLCKVK